HACDSLEMHSPGQFRIFRRVPGSELAVRLLRMTHAAQGQYQRECKHPQRCDPEPGSGAVIYRGSHLAFTLLMWISDGGDFRHIRAAAAQVRSADRPCCACCVLGMNSATRLCTLSVCSQYC